MADLKEVKSRIRIKRGPKTKMSGVTLPKGTPFYNETDNTLLISDGVTELNKHDTLLAELADKSKTSVPQVNIDEVLDNWKKSNHGQGDIMSADAWNNYIKGVYKNSKYTNFMLDNTSGELYFNPLNSNDTKYKIEIKKEISFTIDTSDSTIVLGEALNDGDIIEIIAKTATSALVLRGIVYVRSSITKIPIYFSPVCHILSGNNGGCSFDVITLTPSEAYPTTTFVAKYASYSFYCPSSSGGTVTGDPADEHGLGNVFTIKKVYKIQ